MQGYQPQKYVEKVERVREPLAITREGCLASFRVNLFNDVGKWVVKEFVHDHSHELATTKEVHFLCSHRIVKESDIANAKAMHSVTIQ
ncbi:hypothetical protein Ddye_004934 [Dipteronia dyeriana]|uniref:FAR1 domain-containing protein n=1 Tax=Dipteronia dyeriana TaxID=168575 RepID=A0AAD9XFS3_9ROSI|nr:hypothetical protein Ddye_004934 [Dipteronia dyeriana]